MRLISAGGVAPGPLVRKPSRVVKYDWIGPSPCGLVPPSSDIRSSSSGSSKDPPEINCLLSDCVGSSLACSDPQDLFDRNNDDLAIPDLAGSCRPFDRRDHPVDIWVVDRHLDPGLGYELD